MARTAHEYSRIVFATVLLFGTFVHANCVRFDVPDIAVARTIQHDTKSSLSSQEKLVEFEIDISAFVQLSLEEQISQLVYVIEFPERNAKIVGYSPETSLYSEIAGNVKVNNQKEKSSSIGLNASAVFDKFASAKGNASNSNRKSENVQFERTPEKQWMLASGTMSRGSAVYFKIRPTHQSTLEGARSFKLTLKVDDSWRGDYFKVRCAAYSRNTPVEKPLCGVTNFLVGVFAQNDLVAKRHAKQLVEADYDLRRAASQFRRRPVGESNDFKAAIYTLIRKKKKYEVPENWLSLVLDNRAASRTLDFEQHLPSSVREALFNYRSEIAKMRTIATSARTDSKLF